MELGFFHIISHVYVNTHKNVFESVITAAAKKNPTTPTSLRINISIPPPSWKNSYYTITPLQQLNQLVSSPADLVFRAVYSQRRLPASENTSV